MSSALERLFGRVMSLVSFGRIEAVADLGGRGLRAAQVQIDSGETRDNAPMLGSYGVSARPLAGADAIMLHLGGDRSRTLVIATNDARYQIDLAPGEVALHDDKGSRVHLMAGGVVEVEAEQEIRLLAPRVVTSGDIVVAGKSFLGHRHVETGSITQVPL
ncbi:phage baseplate assembly protein domain-containing protein [Roseomonas sp. USHLN139]|uniref:phage baseplate assembly protein domain-containing protein n=1 Tax=Roseomonas sp. USHLN139 TaxID=3081298 RepID=UPI003B0234BA